MSPRKTTTEVLDDVDEAVGLDLDDDDLEEPEDPPPTTASFMKFVQVGQVYDVVVTEHTRDSVFYEKSCPEVKGKALKPILTFRGEYAITVPVGQELTLTCNTARLASKLDRDSIVGHRLRVEFTGKIHDKGKTINTYKIGISPLPLRLPPGWDAPARDDETPPF
jgi:hypothetical protein